MLDGRDVEKTKLCSQVLNQVQSVNGCQGGPDHLTEEADGIQGSFDWAYSRDAPIHFFHLRYRYRYLRFSIG